MGVLWMLMQPLLFGLIGAEVTLDYLDGNLVGKLWLTKTIIVNSYCLFPLFKVLTVFSIIIFKPLLYCVFTCFGRVTTDSFEKCAI